MFFNRSNNKIHDVQCWLALIFPSLSAKKETEVN